MITLNRKLKKDSSGNAHLQPQNELDTDNLKRVSVRDRLLVKEVQEMEQNLPNSCQVYFSDPNNLSEFSLIISPDEGFWRDGKFKFYVFVPEEYNMTPPIVKCKTKLWHPNISITGDICLSLLRQNSIDGSGWAPTRRLKDVVWGLNSLFTDLLNFDDPLNSEAAEDYLKDKTKFQVSVREYINMFARR